jgi:hypothetical protein
MSRRLDDVRLAVMMIDGIDLKDRTNVVALEITTEGMKIALGLWGGSTGSSLPVSSAQTRGRADRARLISRAAGLAAGTAARVGGRVPPRVKLRWRDEIDERSLMDASLGTHASRT